MIEPGNNDLGMMAIKTVIHCGIHGLNVSHDHINALCVSGVLEVQVGLCPLEMYQQLFSQDLDPVEPEKISRFRRGFLYYRDDIDAA